MASKPPATSITSIVVVALVCLSAVGLPAVASAQENGSNGSAELFIKQPYWVDSEVKRSNNNGTTLYKVTGNHHEIELQNVENHSSVTDFGVTNGPATLSYNKEIGRYVLNAQGADGTFRVFWVASTSRTIASGNNTTTTRTTTERYTATIQVSGADTQHVASGRLSELEGAAANWSQVKDTFGDIGAEDVPIEDKIERAAVVLKFVESPFAALEGQIATILLLLVTTPGGLIVTAAVLIGFAAMIKSLVRRLHRRDKQLEEIEDIEQEKDKQAAKRKAMDLSQCDPTDAGLNDHHATVFRDKVAPNLLMIMDSLAREIPRGRWAKINLQVLNQLGYAARTDEVGEDGSIETIEFIDPEDVTEDLLDHDEDVHSLDDPSDAVIDATTAEDLRALRVEFVRSDIDASAVDLPVGNNEDEDGDLIDAWDIDIGPDFESRERFTEEVLNIITFVAAHPYTDDEGNIRQDMDLLSLLNLLTAAGAERYDLPRMPDYQMVFELAIENLSQSERSQTTINEIRNNATRSGD